MDVSYLRRVTQFFEDYFEIPKFYYMNGPDVIREEAVQDLMRQLIAMEVFQDEADVRREAVKFYNLMLPPLE